VKSQAKTLEGDLKEQVLKKARRNFTLGDTLFVERGEEIAKDAYKQIKPVAQEMVAAIDQEIKQRLADSELTTSAAVQQLRERWGLTPRYGAPAPLRQPVGQLQLAM